jgi:hypothetical protein
MKKYAKPWEFQVLCELSSVRPLQDAVKNSSIVAFSRFWWIIHSEVALEMTPRVSLCSPISGSVK